MYGQVRVLFDIPYQIDGVACLKYVGAGLVVDAALGLVLVDRNTVRRLCRSPRACNWHASRGSCSCGVDCR